MGEYCLALVSNKSLTKESAGQNSAKLYDRTKALNGKEKNTITVPSSQHHEPHLLFHLPPRLGLVRRRRTGRRGMRQAADVQPDSGYRKGDVPRYSF